MFISRRTLVSGLRLTRPLGVVRGAFASRPRGILLTYFDIRFEYGIERIVHTRTQRYIFLHAIYLAVTTPAHDTYRRSRRHTASAQLFVFGLVGIERTHHDTIRFALRPLLRSQQHGIYPALHKHRQQQHDEQQRHRDDQTPPLLFRKDLHPLKIYR